METEFAVKEQSIHDMVQRAVQQAMSKRQPFSPPAKETHAPRKNSRSRKNDRSKSRSRKNDRSSSKNRKQWRNPSQDGRSHNNTAQNRRIRSKQRRQRTSS